MKTAFLAVLISAIVASGCSAGALAGALGIPSPTPTPALVVTPKTLTMKTTGSTQIQTITASESGQTFFTAQSSDITIATVVPVQNTSNAFTVTAVKAGTTTIDVTDGNSQTTKVPVTVTN
jgi:hypothetical protein